MKIRTLALVCLALSAWADPWGNAPAPSPRPSSPIQPFQPAPGSSPSTSASGAQGAPAPASPVESGIVDTNLEPVPSGSVLRLRPQGSAEANAFGSVAFSPDGRWIASGHQNGLIHLWKVVKDDDKDCKVTGIFERIECKGHTGPVTRVRWSPKGDILVSSSADKTLRIWNASTGAEEQCLRAHKSTVHDVALSPDETRLASAGEDRTIRIWDLGKKGSEPEKIELVDAATCVAFSPDKQILAYGTGAWEKRIHLWDLDAHKETGLLKDMTGKVGALLFSPDGKFLASGGADRLARRWEMPGKKTRDVLKETDIAAVAFSPDGGYLACGGEDPSVHVWDLSDTRSLLKALPGHRGSLSSLSYSPNGKYLVSGSGDGTALVWNSPERKAEK